MFFRREDAHESKLNFKSCEATLHRLKNEKYPEIPKSHQQIKELLEKPENLEKYGMTLTKKKPFYIGSVVNEKFSFFVFASLLTIEFIKEHIKVGQRFYLMDGTFQTAPRNFYQTLIISIEYKNDVCSKNMFP